MSLSPEQAAFAQRDYIYNLFKAQTNVGPTGVPNTGTNNNGKLKLVASLGRKTIWPNFEQLPFVGVQLLQQDEKLYGSPRKHEIWTTLKVGVSVDVIATGTSVLKVDAAYDLLEELIDDGQGNGVCPLLRASANYNLGTTGGMLNSEMSYLPKVIYNWDEKPQSKGSAYFAFAVVTVRAIVHLQLPQ